MKAGKSSLNPYAESYVPLSRRAATDENRDSKLTATDSKSDSEKVWLGFYSQDTKQNQLQRKNDYAVRAHTFHGSYGSSSHNPSEVNEKQILDEEFDMDLAYLQMTFPGISDESLSGVYLANKGDLEATIDMLSQLELYAGDSSDNLPDTLDIGDVSESAGSSSDAASLKLKVTKGEVGTSSSGTS